MVCDIPQNLDRQVILGILSIGLYGAVKGRLSIVPPSSDQLQVFCTGLLLRLKLRLHQVLSE